MKLVINLPAFNEEEKIGETIKRIPKAIPGIDEIFIQVIDDGSRDKTAKICKEAGAHCIFSHEANRGIGIVFRSAVEKALENGADIMVNIDADGQFNPNDIEKLIQPILHGEADLVSADRFSDHKAKNIPFSKSLLNQIAASIIGRFMGMKINDLTCGFRAYNRETLLRLNLPGNFTYTQEVIIDAIGKNLKVKWIPVEVTYFEQRKSRVVKSIYRYVNNSFRIIIKTIRDVRPMKFFGIPGSILMGLGLVIFIIFLSLYLEDFKISIYKNYLLTAGALFIIGLQFLVFAFIADMIKSSRKLAEDIMYFIKKEKYRK